VRTAFLEYLLLILIAMTVVVLIRVVGIFCPCADHGACRDCGMLTSNLKKRMIILFCLAAFFVFPGYGFLMS
jgi:zinc transport system permease protein